MRPQIGEPIACAAVNVIMYTATPRARTQLGRYSWSSEFRVAAVAVHPKPSTNSSGSPGIRPGTTIVSPNAIPYTTPVMLSTSLADTYRLILPMLNAATIAPTPNAVKSSPYPSAASQLPVGDQWQQRPHRCRRRSEDRQPDEDEPYHRLVTYVPSTCSQRRQEPLPD